MTLRRSDRVAHRIVLTRHQRVTLFVSCIGTFVGLIDGSIVNTALPSIERDLHASFSGLQWVVDAYTLVPASLLLTMGALADRYGRRRFFAGGMAVFTLGSLLCGLSVSAINLNLARALQGAGGAALVATSLAILATAFPNQSERVWAVALWSAISGIALGIGPTLGGLLVVGFGWRWVFFINVPIGIACLVFGVRRLDESKDPAARRVDLPGQLSSIGWLASLTYAFIERGTHPWNAAAVSVPLLLAVVLLGVFLFVEHRSKDPMLPLELFKSTLFSSTAFVTFLLGLILIAVPFFTAQYFQNVDHLSALASGLRMLAYSGCFAVGAPMAGKLARRFGIRTPVSFGALLAASGLILLSQISSTSHYSEIWWRLAMIGIGFSLMTSPLSAAILAAVDRARSGLASSVAGTTRQVGMVVGIALLGALVQTTASRSAATQLSSLPRSVAAALASSIGTGGGQIAPRLKSAPGFTAARLTGISGRAYVAGLHRAFEVGGCVIFVGAVTAVLFLRLSSRSPSAGAPPAEQEPADLGNAAPSSPAGVATASVRPS